jgi:hypothetical protein
MLSLKAPFSVPFRSVPFRSVPFRSVPFRSVVDRRITHALIFALLLLLSANLHAQQDINTAEKNLTSITQMEKPTLPILKPEDLSPLDWACFIFSWTGAAVIIVIIIISEVKGFLRWREEKRKPSSLQISINGECLRNKLKKEGI